MGLLDKYRKESTTHFERDESGRVVNVERTEPEPRRSIFNRESKTPVSDALLGQDREKRKAERKTPVSDALLGQDREKRKAERKIVRQEQRVKQKKLSDLRRKEYETGLQLGAMKAMRKRGFDAGMRKYSGYSTQNNYNPFGTMFDTGMTTPKKRKTSTKKKTTRKKTKPVSYGYDIFDNWGLMR